MDAHTKKIKDILNGARLLEIPYYQRSYVWNEELWKRFLEDIVELTLPNAKPHFFGSIILKQQMTPAMGGVSDIRTVIDGQQRLTTIAIFFKVLSLKPGLKAAASGLLTLDKYLTLPDWNEVEIKNRAEDLYKQILSVWQK